MTTACSGRDGPGTPVTRAHHGMVAARIDLTAPDATTVTALCGPRTSPLIEKAEARLNAANDG